MHELWQACIAPPGTSRTLEKIYESRSHYSQRPLELREKPCCFANLDGSYDHLFGFLGSCDCRGAAAAAEPRARPVGPDCCCCGAGDSNSAARRGTGHDVNVG